MKTIKFASSIVLDEVAHIEPPHLYLHCLLSILYFYEGYNFITRTKHIWNFTDVNFGMCFFFRGEGDGGYEEREESLTVKKKTCWSCQSHKKNLM